MVTLTFITASIALLLTPGPTNTLLATCGATLRLRQAALMPFAEAIGYIIAIAFFFTSAEMLRGNAASFALMKLIAAAWLLYSALRLWTTPFEPTQSPPRRSFVRVLLTTILNPKAMLVGTLFIPPQAFGDAVPWIATYAALSIMAGFGWVLLGSLLPLPVRRHSYRGAAVVLTGFCIAAVASVVG